MPRINWALAGSAGEPASASADTTFAPTSSGAAANDSNAGAGKLDFDFGDIVGSIGNDVGSMASFGAGLVGGAAGAVGQIGFGDGKNIGALGDVPGNVLGTIGSAPLPYLGSDKSRPNATLGDVPGMMLQVVGAPEKAVERTIAGWRTEGARTQHDLPPDLQFRLDQGESASSIADALVQRNAGFTNDPTVNLATALVVDPLNYIGLGAGKVLGLAKGASISVHAAEDGARLGLGTRLMGAAYDAATTGLDQRGAAVMDRLLGPSTIGSIRAFGAGTYTSVRASLGTDAADALDEALGVAQANHLQAVMASEMASEAKRDLPIILDKGALAEATAARLGTSLELSADGVQRSVEQLVRRTAQRFRALTPEERGAQAARELAVVTGEPEEIMARAIGPTASVETTQLVREALFGRAVSDLGPAKIRAFGARNLDVGRITVLAPQTLTQDRAAAVLKAIKRTGMAAASDAVGQYDELAREFLGRTFTADDVARWISDAKAGLPTEVHLPRSGKNPLPASLASWRARYEPVGYRLGFEPETSWKTVERDGVRVPLVPWVPLTGGREVIYTRNGFGRAADGLLRGISQAQIINAAARRFTDAAIAKAGMSEAEAQAVFRAILNRAHDLQSTPRGLAYIGSGTYGDVFGKVLGEARAAEVRQHVNPAYLVMHAFENDLSNVGLTQKITGRAKTWTSESGNLVAGIAEGIWPNLKFKWNPLFQAQELLESPWWNAMRGVNPWGRVDPDFAKVFEAVTASPRARNVFEAGYAAQFAGAYEARRAFGAQTKLGQIARRFPDVQAYKARQAVLQAFHDYGDEFQAAIMRVNPKLWPLMVADAGTSDAKAVALHFLKGRLALADGQRAAVEAMDAAKVAAAGKMDAASETAWQAAVYAMRKVSDQAYRTHFFNPERGWLERTLNHPYLGLYPLSYMWGKVVPEFARFLFRRPFGLNAPLAGYEAARHVQQAVVAQMQDPEFAQAVKDHEGTIYFVQLMVPGTPYNAPVNAPAWARHVATGKSKGPSQEAADLIQHVGLLNAPETVGEGIAPLAEDASAAIRRQLDQAARLYDGNRDLIDWAAQQPRLTP